MKEITIKPEKANCEICGREYIYYPESKYIPATCPYPECLWKWLHRNEPWYQKRKGVHNASKTKTLS